MSDGRVTLHGQFDLRPGCSAEDFKAAYDAFSAHLRALGFVHTWRLMRRCPHPGYDTHPPPTEFVADLVFN
ncbi:MAG: DUF6614 family protein, partial [Pseudomonadota bacterium]